MITDIQIYMLLGAWVLLALSGVLVGFRVGKKQSQRKITRQKTIRVE